MTSIFKILLLCTLMIYKVNCVLTVDYENNELYNCVNRVIETIFKEEETIIFSISDSDNFVFSNTIANPRLIFSEKNLIKDESEVGFRIGMVLYVDGLENSKRIERIWYATLVINNISPNVKWFIITPRPDIASYFKQLWLRDVLHIVVLQYNLNSTERFLRIFTANPQAIPNKCGTVLNLVNNQTCDSNLVVEYPKPLRKYTNCTFKIMTSTELRKDKKQNNHTVKIIHNFLIKQISSQLDSNYARYSKTDRSMIISLTILRYEDTGILSSIIFYSAKAMWAVPKPKLIPLIKVIGIIFNKTVWTTIVLSFIVTATIWWLIVKYAKKYVKDKCSFTMILLNTWELTLFGCVNRIPVLWATRLLVISYIICFIHIQAVFNSKIVEVLTVPQYEHGIQNLEDLLDSGLEILVHPNVKYLVFVNSSNDGDVRYNKALQLLSELEYVEEITEVLSECIINSKCAAFFTGEEPYLNDEVLGISNIINDNALTGNFDAIVSYPGGSYISLSVNTIVEALVESGIMNNFIKKLEKTKFEFESEKPLTFDNLYAVFIFLVYIHPLIRKGNDKMAPIFKLLFLFPLIICKINCVLKIEDENNDLYNCVYRAIEKIFNEEETILFSMAASDNFTFSNTIANPRLIFSEKNLLKDKSEVGFRMGIVLFVDAVENTKRIESIWFARLVIHNITPNVKWFIITPRPNIASYFIQLWSREVLHIVVLQYNSNSLPLFTADPQAIPNKCGTTLNVVNNQTCDSNIVVEFPKPLRKYTNCTFKIMTSTELMKDRKQNNHTIKNIYKFLVKQISSQLNSNNAPYSFRDRNMIIAVTILRYEDYGIVSSSIFYSAKAMWAVPKPKQIPLIKVIGLIFDKTVWAIIILSFIATSIFWWLIVKYAKEYVKDNCTFTLIMLNTWELTLFGYTNRFPVIYATRFLVIAYIICFIHIVTVFNSKIVEVLTVPQYERGLRNLEDVLDSGLEIIVHPFVKELVFTDSILEGDVRYHKVQQLLSRSRHVEEIDEILIDCITKYQCVAFFSGEEPYLNNDVLEISNIIKDNSLTGNFDAIVSYPDASYISLTVNRIVGALVESGIMNDFIEKVKMPEFKFESDNKKPLTLDNLHAVFIFLGVEDENNELHDCVSRVTENVFNEGETLLVLTSAGGNNFFSNTIRNTRLIFTKEELYNTNVSLRFQMGIVLHMDATENSNSLDLIWTSKLVELNINAIMKWVIITPNPYIEGYFLELWEREVIYLVVLVYNSNGFLRLFTADPQAISNKCGTALNFINNHTCNSKIAEEFPKPLRKYTNCTFNIFTFADIEDNKYVVSTVNNFLLKQINNHLNSNYLYYFGQFDEVRLVVLSSFLRYVDDGFHGRTIFYSTKATWAVPKPKQIPLIEVIGVIFKISVWTAIVCSFVMTAIFWWLIVKYAEDKCSFFMILLNTWGLTLFGCVNKVPKFWASRIVVIAYIICFIHIQAVFNSKIVEVVTLPQYERGIRNLEDLSKSNLQIIVHPVVKELVFSRSNIDKDDRYNKIHQLLSDLKTDECIEKLIINCITESKCAAFFSGEEQYLKDDILQISNIIKDNSVTGNFDSVFKYLSGSYIALTWDKIVETLVESGIVDDFVKSLEIDKFKFVSTDRRTPLAVDNLYAFFIFLGIGLAISMIVFVCEVIIKHCNLF
ncbi:hypothetical protein FQR65_LT13380 [Abscondita terminalis]|nr:hypothetical protein FQR65_LT13380 [Abscondita terminalis]